MIDISLVLLVSLFKLLDLLNRAGAALSLNELASQVKLTRSSTFRLLYTLQKSDHVFQDGEGKYSIAIENWISSSRQVANALLKVAPVRAKELHAKFHESVSLAVFFQNHIEVVQVFESPQAVRMANSCRRNRFYHMPALWARQSQHFRLKKRE